MATLKELYKLVHALDKSEKKNLSILIEALGGKARQRYAKSLRIINEQKDFDADKLKAKLGADVSGMSLTEANDYFFAFICKSLISNQTPATGNLGLLKEIILVETFVSKGLFDLADRHLQPLLEKLHRGNSFGLLSRGLELHSIVVSSNDRTKHEYKKRLEIIETREQVSRNHLQYIEIIRLNQRLDETVQQVGDPRQKSHLNLYEAIYKDAVCHIPYKEVSTQAFTMYAPLRTGIVGMIEGNQAAIRECRIALEEFHKRLNFRDHFVVAFYLYDNLISDCIREREAESIPPIIADMEKLLPYVKQRGVRQKVTAKIMFSELSLDIISRQYKRGVENYERWTKEELKQTWNEAPLAYMNYLLGARLYYLNNNPDKALDELLALRPIEKGFRASLTIAYRFMFLLCYYKLGNYSLVTSTADSIYKSLLKQEKLYAPERAMLRFVKSSTNPDKLNNNLKTLYSTLLDLSKDHFNESFFQHGDYLEWLQVEIEKKKR